MPISHDQPSQTCSVTVKVCSEQGGEIIKNFGIWKYQVVFEARRSLFAGGLCSEVIYIGFLDGRTMVFVDRWSLTQVRLDCTIVTV